MRGFAGRRVVLGVCGGIAAYKAVSLCRLMVDAGAHVSVVMTDDATRFVGEVTFSALSSEPVRRSLFEDTTASIPHTQLGQNADLVVVAPATARLISAYAAGYSHDLLTNVLIATTAPVVLAPAMHTEMWQHPAVRHNISVLRDRGVHVVGPASGHLAGGDEGPGRLVEPIEIVDHIDSEVFGVLEDLAGLEVLVTAGGTREPIDPVRFIGNRSSGKQGHAIAEAAARRGAKVTVVTTVERPVPAGVERVMVDTARSMNAEVTARAPSADVVVMAAAVADFTVGGVAEHKLKKRDGVPAIQLEPTVDILAGLGSRKPEGQILVGFAAETRELVDNARAKLEAKGADLLVANDVASEHAGFEHDTNEVVILTQQDEWRVGPVTKLEIAHAVLDAVVEKRGANGR
ncbi:MAG: bifunctional phosphopantothenoylcysteine decarboxylase/phosphopantothenate--cysteine ligase CoaBC [Microthrixaceae bacterium]